MKTVSGSRIPIVLLTGEESTERAVSDALARSDRFAPDTVCRSLPDLQGRLQKSASPAVLVDIDPQPRKTLKELDPLIAGHASSRFIVLSKDLQSDLVLEAMQAGARHFILKSNIASELTGVLNKLVLDGKPEGKGCIVTFLSAGGGAGATTISVNLAGELQAIGREPVLVIDMDAAYGTAGTYLGLKGGYGIADVLRGTSRIDEELIGSTVVTHPDGIHLLLSPASTSFSSPYPLEFSHVDSVLRACRRAYRYTVIDAPRLPIEVSAGLARASILTLVVLQLTVKDVRIAREISSALAARGVPEGRIVPLVNRYRKGSPMITLDEAHKALGSSPIVFTNDYKSAIQSTDYGQLLSKAARRSPLRQDLVELASRIVNDHAKGQQPGMTS